MQSGNTGGSQDFSGTQIIGVGVSGALAGDHANAHAQRNSLRGGLHDPLVDADHAGGEVLEIQIRVVPVLRERFGQIPLQIAPFNTKTNGKKRLGKCHGDFFNVITRSPCGRALRRTTAGP